MDLRIAGERLGECLRAHNLGVAVEDRGVAGEVDRAGHWERCS